MYLTRSLAETRLLCVPLHVTTTYKHTHTYAQCKKPGLQTFHGRCGGGVWLVRLGHPLQCPSYMLYIYLYVHVRISVCLVFTEDWVIICVYTCIQNSESEFVWVKAHLRCIGSYCSAEFHFPLFTFDPPKLEYYKPALYIPIYILFAMIIVWLDILKNIEYMFFTPIYWNNSKGFKVPST